jgi:hypothetical protein
VLTNPEKFVSTAGSGWEAALSRYKKTKRIAGERSTERAVTVEFLDAVFTISTTGGYCLIRRPKRKRLTPSFVRHFHRPRLSSESFGRFACSSDGKLRAASNGRRI